VERAPGAPFAKVVDERQRQPDLADRHGVEPQPAWPLARRWRRIAETLPQGRAAASPRSRDHDLVRKDGRPGETQERAIEAIHGKRV
jgi:hypothetical protein